MHSALPSQELVHLLLILDGVLVLLEQEAHSSLLSAPQQVVLGLGEELKQMKQVASGHTHEENALLILLGLDLELIDAAVHALSLHSLEHHVALQVEEDLHVAEVGVLGQVQDRCLLPDLVVLNVVDLDLSFLDEVELFDG